MLEPDLHDTHLCIKCSATIVGLDKYIEHRKNNCNNARVHNQQKVTATADTNRNSANVEDSIIADDNELSHAEHTRLAHTYEAFSYHEPEAPTTYVNKNQHGGKTTKSLTDAYELPYELDADVFFSSLQLQSVQSTGPSTSGKTGSTITQSSTLQRQKNYQHPAEGGKVGWMSHNTFGEIGVEEKQSYEHMFKPISFTQESPDLSEDEEEIDVDNDDDDDDDDGEFIAITAAAHSSGGKWKSSPLMRHSPPVVPANYTGGKWRPGNRPNLRVTHTQLSRLSPNWDEQIDDVETPGTPEAQQQQHPPAEHTKGKWIPGTKLQRLEYKEVLLDAKTAEEDYWCNICCRRLKNKLNYDNHLKTGYHLKRAEPEQQLEKAALAQMKHVDVDKIFAVEKASNTEILTKEDSSKKRKRRTTFIRCDLCKHTMARHMIGKHLISHFHYRRMHVDLSKSLRTILEHIHSIVLQSPFQCRPCRFYANTEETFLQHWNSVQHLDATESAGKFYCSYCQYECEDNNQMRRHLVSSEHKEVILAINRSVPICISKKLSINCVKCRQTFRYNAELRQHMLLMHAGEEITGTASDAYQSRFKCKLCDDCFCSQISLQRHEKFKHSVFNFFCSICKLNFETAVEAGKHRKTNEHRKQAALAMRAITKKKAANQKNCSNCNFNATSEVEAMLHELTHTNNNDTNKPSTSTEHNKIKLPKIKKTQKRLKSQDKISKLKCRDCEKFFSMKSDLKQHRDSEHNHLSHRCSCCGESFVSAQALGRHTRQCKPTDQPFQKLMPTKNRSKIKVENNWTCQLCGFSCLYESELIYHRLFHTHGQLTKNQLIKCPLCEKSFRKHSLRCHLRQHTNEKIFECEFCKLKFSRRHNLKDHVNRQHKPEDTTADNNDTKHNRNKSSETFASSNDTKIKQEKEQSITGSIKMKQRFQCDICDKQFSTKYSLKLHNQVKHNLVQRHFVCSYEGCHYAAISQNALKIHLTSHAEEKLICDHPNCNYIGKSVLHLVRHRRLHITPTKLFACDQCEFQTRIKGHLRRHMHMHNGGKPHQCPHCNFKCSSADNLRKHILKTNLHPGKFIYECKHCEQNSKRRIELEEHENFVFKTNSYHQMQIHLNTVHLDERRA